MREAPPQSQQPPSPGSRVLKVLKNHGERLVCLSSAIGEQVPDVGSMFPILALPASRSAAQSMAHQRETCNFNEQRHGMLHLDADPCYLPRLARRKAPGQQSKGPTPRPQHKACRTAPTLTQHSEPTEHLHSIPGCPSRHGNSTSRHTLATRPADSTPPCAQGWGGARPRKNTALLLASAPGLHLLLVFRGQGRHKQFHSTWPCVVGRFACTTRPPLHPTLPRHGARGLGQGKGNNKTHDTHRGACCCVIAHASPTIPRRRRHGRRHLGSNVCVKTATAQRVGLPCRGGCTTLDQQQPSIRNASNGPSTRHFQPSPCSRPASLVHRSRPPCVRHEPQPEHCPCQLRRAIVQRRNNTTEKTKRERNACFETLQLAADASF